MKFKVGDVVTLHLGLNPRTISKANMQGGQATYTLRDENGYEGFHWWHDHELILIKRKSMYEEGQILARDGSSFDREVIGVVGKAVFTQDMDDRHLNYDSAERLEGRGWLPKGEEPEVKEVTLDEIAAKFDLKPEQIRIKKED